MRFIQKIQSSEKNPHAPPSIRSTQKSGALTERSALTEIGNIDSQRLK